MSDDKELVNGVDYGIGVGRKPGSKNKRYSVEAQLKLAGVDLVHQILKDAQDASVKPVDRAKIYLELLQYIAPKQKSVEVLQDIPTQMTITFQSPETRTADEIRADKLKESGEQGDEAAPE